MPQIRTRKFGRALLVAGSLIGLFAGETHAMPVRHSAQMSNAGSIAYQLGANIWVARPDGSVKHQVTRDGTPSNPYLYPTQADNGTIETLKFTTLYHLNRNGGAIGPKLVVATGPNNNFSLHTLAFDPAISHNGRFVAVSIVEYQGIYDPNTGGHGANIIAQDMQYWDASTGKKLAVTHLAGTYLMAPSWIDNAHLLIFAPYNSYAPEVYVDERNRPGWNWFADSDPGSYDRQSLNHGELTRQRDKLALIRGANLKNEWRGSSIQIYSVSSLHATPTAICSISAQHGALGKPTWSPDGTTLAWSDSNGIWESPVAKGSPNCGLSPRLVIRGGANPDWGPAGVAG